MPSTSKYDPSQDKILWESEPVQFKPQATVKAQIKQYQNNSPKLLIVEEGVGFSKKAYSGYILKRLEIERIDLVIELLTQGKQQLKDLLLAGMKPSKPGD